MGSEIFPLQKKGGKNSLSSRWSYLRDWNCLWVEDALKIALGSSTAFYFHGKWKQFIVADPKTLVYLVELRDVAFSH